MFCVVQSTHVGTNKSTIAFVVVVVLSLSFNLSLALKLIMHINYRVEGCERYMMALKQHSNLKLIDHKMKSTAVSHLANQR